MKITQLYLYPIKALRPLSVQNVRLERYGLQYDRRFMLLKVRDDGSFTSIQTVHFPECTLFSQEIQGDEIVVTYDAPKVPLITPTPEQHTALEVPLNPDTEALETVATTIGGSGTTAYRMGKKYDSWFASCLGYEVHLVYIGDGKREVLAHAPPSSQSGWLSTISSYVGWGAEALPPPSLTFNEVAPFLVTSEASLRDVSARLSAGTQMDMIKFRPNIVVDGEDSWDEDFWGELTVEGRHKLHLTANCGRCGSINIDYQTGRPADGELGMVLKMLMKDRRVDMGNKWSPIFGRYAFLEGGAVEVAVGDQIAVTKRNETRCVWAWPKA